MSGKVIIRAPSRIPHGVIALAITDEPNVDPGLLDAILSENYEFQITAERESFLESAINGYTRVQKDPEPSAFIEECESETMRTKPEPKLEPKPGPSRIIPPVATTIDEEGPINQTAPTDPHTGEAYNGEGTRECSNLDSSPTKRAPVDEEG